MSLQEKYEKAKDLVQSGMIPSAAFKAAGMTQGAYYYYRQKDEGRPAKKKAKPAVQMRVVDGGAPVAKAAKRKLPKVVETEGKVIVLVTGLSQLPGLIRSLQ